MSDGPELLRAIHAAPADDATRGAFADWLQEQDNPHAMWYGRFIARQLARLPWGTDDGDRWYIDTMVGPAALHWKTLGVRQYPHQIALPEPMTVWRTSDGPVSQAPLAGFPLTGEYVRLDFHRGFVARAELTVTNLVPEVLGLLFARHPVEDVDVPHRYPIEISPGEYVWMPSMDPVQIARDPWRLPPAVFHAIPVKGEQLSGLLESERTTKSFPAPADAALALRAGVLAVGRSRAAELLAQPLTWSNL